MIELIIAWIEDNYVIIDKFKNSFNMYDIRFTDMVMLRVFQASSSFGKNVVIKFHYGNSEIASWVIESLAPPDTFDILKARIDGFIRTHP